MNTIALFITFITGFLFLVGFIVIKIFKNKDLIHDFANALSFSVIIGLLAFDLIPEIFECFETLSIYKQIVYILGFMLIGLILLKLLDCVVPVHNHEHHDHNDNHEEHTAHFYHVGVVTSLALIIHNIIEGIAVYTISCINYKSGIFMAFGVGLHNIPMGIQIATSFNESNKKKKTQLLIVSLLVVSPLIGAIIMLFTNDINDMLIGISMCITCGMLIYIAMFELLNEIRHEIKSKVTMIGLVIGISLMLITFFL